MAASGTIAQRWSATRVPIQTRFPTHLAADVELIPIQKINEAYQRMIKGDVKYRFVVDMKSLKG